MIYVLTVVHNNLDGTRKLLNSIKKQNYHRYKVILVDDKSSDVTASFIKTKYPEITLLMGDGNLWWTGGLNLGVEHILKIAKKNDFILTINNDCQFGSNYFRTLLSTIKKHPKSVVGSLVVNKNNKRKIWDAGVTINWETGKIGALFPEGADIKLLGKTSIQSQIDTITTKGTLFPVEVFIQEGLFDQKHFPHYFSDYEFGIRLKKNGWNLLINYQAVVENDIQNTGIDYSNAQISIPYAWQLLFSKRSRVNLNDQVNLIRICCPPELRTKNYLLLFKRMLDAGYKVLNG